MREGGTRGGPYSAALATGVVWGLLLWIGERLFASPPSVSAAMASGFFLLIMVWPFIVLTGLFWQVTLGLDNPYHILAGGLRRHFNNLLQKNPEAGFRLTNALFWGGFSLALATFGAVTMCRSIAIEVVRPEYQGILSVGATVGAFVLSIPVFVFGLALGRKVAPQAKRIPVVRACFGRPMWPLLAALVVSLGGVVLFVLKFHAEIAASPWQVPALLLGSLLLAMFIGGLVSTLLRFRFVGAAFALVLLALTLVTMLEAVGLDPGDRLARRLFRAAPATSLAYSLVEKTLDRDGDGFMQAFAGGDCAPDDGTIFPLAVDIPGNGIDEDCVGGDLDFLALEGGRWDYPTPSDFPRGKLPVVLITVDALSANHLHMNGYPRPTTPNLDEFSKGCVVFDKAFSQGPSTRLSLGALLGGVYDSQLARTPGHQVPLRLEGENIFFSEVLDEAGYDTVFISPTSYMHRRFKGLLQGFDTVQTKGASRSTKQAVHSAGKLTELAVDEVRRERSNPLFLWVHYWDAHPPFAQPEGAPVFGTGKKDLYDAEVASWDSHITPLLDEVSKQFKDGYVLIITADHGSAFDSRHARRTHGYDLHTPVLHIPLMVCSNHIPPRRVTETTVTLLDIFPTLANLLALDTSVALEGTSLVPLLFGPLEWPRRLIFHQFYLAEKISQGADPLYAVSVRDGRYDYIWNRKKNDYSLYDWEADPFEETDLSDNSPELASHYDGILKNWLARVYDQSESEAAGDDGSSGP